MLQSQCWLPQQNEVTRLWRRVGAVDALVFASLTAWHLLAATSFCYRAGVARSWLRSSHHSVVGHVVLAEPRSYSVV